MITVAQFMQDAMYNSKEGYYINGKPIGKEGDFITAPEISQLFGEMIGIFCADMWIKMGQPAKFNLVELGPGKATLMVDMLRATKHIAGFQQACQINLVEVNNQLIAIQKEKLSSFNCNWHKDIFSLPDDAPLIIIANEFFDCLPINQYLNKNNKWYEIYVSENQFVDKPLPTELAQNLIDKYPHNQSIVEICYPALEIIKSLSIKLQNILGCLLIIDYGYDFDHQSRRNYGSSLQAIKNHQYQSIFNDIYQSDLTAHVDFFALKEVALAANCNIAGAINQQEFLQNLGINIRADRLKKNATLEQSLEIDAAIARLTDYAQMGSLFKVLSIFSKTLAQPLGF